MREISADEQAAGGGYRSGTGYVVRDPLELSLQHLREAAMTAAEALQNLRIQRFYLIFRNGQYSLHQQMGSWLTGQQRLFAGQIGLREHAPCVRQEAMPCPGNRDGFHRE